MTRKERYKKNKMQKKIEEIIGKRNIESETIYAEQIERYM